MKASFTANPGADLRWRAAALDLTEREGDCSSLNAMSFIGPHLLSLKNRNVADFSTSDCRMLFGET